MLTFIISSIFVIYIIKNSLLFIQIIMKNKAYLWATAFLNLWPFYCILKIRYPFQHSSTSRRVYAVYAFIPILFYDFRFLPLSFLDSFWFICLPVWECTVGQNLLIPYLSFFFLCIAFAPLGTLSPK